MKDLQTKQTPALIVSFFYFFFLLGSYYILRPVRDSLVSGLGTDEVKFLSIFVFFAMLAVAPLFGALMTRFPRRKLLPVIYAFFAINLLLFAPAFSSPQALANATRLFYVWITVFNMFVVSVFWSVMADIWTESQGRRFFGVIAAGGSAGGLCGSYIAQLLVQQLGNQGLTVLAACILGCTVACLLYLNKHRAVDRGNAQAEAAFTGSSWQGIVLVARSPFLLGIAALVTIGAGAAMFAYIETGKLAKELLTTPEARTIFFARIDLWTNIAALIFQLLVVGLLTSRFGIVAPLVGLAIIGCLSFGALALSPFLMTLGTANVARRAAEFGLGKPGRDMLYTVTTPQEKYLAKNVIDTVIARGADVLGGWSHGVLSAIGLTLVGISWVAATAMAFAMFIALRVVRGYRARGGK